MPDLIIKQEQRELRIGTVGLGGSLSDSLPSPLGTAAAGVGLFASRFDHVHAHGNLAGGSLHAVATNAVAGFMSATDKANLDTLVSSAALLSNVVPLPIGAAALAGAGNSAARYDHVHTHGNQVGGALHAVATGSVAGFMSAADKTAFDAHLIAIGSVHGVTGSVVGTTDTQVLTNKTLTTPTIASFVNATHSHLNAAGGGVLSAAAVTSGVFSTARLGTGVADATKILYGDGTWGAPTGGGGGVTAHSALTGLTVGDDHTQYALLAGRAGGQTIKGGSGASQKLLLQSTSNVTRGLVGFVDDADLQGNALYLNGSGANGKGVLSYSSLHNMVQLVIGDNGLTNDPRVFVGVGNGDGYDEDVSGALTMGKFGDVGLVGNSSHLAVINTVDAASNDTTFELGGGITAKTGDGFCFFNCGAFSGSTDEMKAAAGVQRFMHAATEVNQSGTASFVGLRVEMAVRASGSGYHRLFDLGVSSGTSGQMIGVSAQNGTGEGLFTPQFIVEQGGTVDLATAAQVKWSSTSSAAGSIDTTLKRTGVSTLTLTDGGAGTGTLVAALTGNASTATKLFTARNIAGVSFDGSGNIAIPHTNLTGLTSGDDHTQYALLAGRAGGQVQTGGTASGENYTIRTTAHATKGKLLIGTSAYDEANNRLGIATASPTHALTLAQGAQWAHYNTVDQTVNYERAVGFWVSNIYVIQAQNGGSGTSRSLEMVSSDGSGIRASDFGGVDLLGSSSGFVTVAASDGNGVSLNGRLTSNTNQANLRLINTTFGTPYSASSGRQSMVAIDGTVNQSSTAAYTILALSATESSLGAGPNWALTATVGGSLKFGVTNAGEIYGRRPVLPKAVSYAVQATDSGATFTNEGAAGVKPNFTLPTAVAGLKYTFVVQDSDGLKVTANSGDSLRIANQVSALAGNIDSVDIGNTVTLEAINATEWVAVSVIAFGGGWVIT